MSEVTLAIPADSILMLPSEASFTGKSGRANVEVSRKGNTIVVRASCDSLQVRLEYYERQSATYREAYERLQSLFEEERERRSNPVKTFFAGVGIGIAITILATIIIKNKLKHGN